jgi:DNA polymerase-3 subunit epsilon
MNPRQIVLDTETTGLNPKSGDRIIEIGCIELINRRRSGRTLHLYVNPERDSEPGALAVHGLTRDFLADKPKFAEVAQEVLEFVRGGEILIHNAAFDLAFLDAELERLEQGPFRELCSDVVDTLQLAKELHPGKRNSLDVLCERYGVSNAHRTLHGALLDAELLAEVYLAMTRGQDSLVIEIEAPVASQRASDAAAGPRAELIVVRATDEERAAHEAILQAMEKHNRQAPVWRSSEPALASTSH